MISFLTTLIILTSTGVIQGSFLHPSTGYDYSQRTSRPSTYAVSVPLYQRLAAALSALNSNAVAHDAAGCALNHGQDPDQGEVVQSAAYPQVTLYQPNYQQAQWNPVPYNQPIAYHHPVAVNRIRTVNRVPALALEGIQPVDYGYHHPSSYLQPLY